VERGRGNERAGRRTEGKEKKENGGKHREEKGIEGERKREGLDFIPFQKFLQAPKALSYPRLRHRVRISYFVGRTSTLHG